MGTNPAESGSTLADSIHFLFKESGSTSRISESRTVIHLPLELITEILVRLPVKSLLRFKCVCKPWLSLISDTKFIWSHFSKSEADGLKLQLLLATETGMKKCGLHSALHEADPSMHLSPIDFPAQNIRSIVGVVNGLFCLNLKGTDLCVWNPALNKIKHLNAYPEPPFARSCWVQYYFSFGYVESNDDYKVVCLQSELGCFVAEVRIYSLKADSWRRIDPPFIGFHLPYPGVFAYGKIYWSFPLMVCPNSKYVSLDLSSEKFVELQLPQYEYDAGNCRLRTGESGGRPFLLCEYAKGMKLDLWVLDKRGLEESWCKLVSIPYTDVNHKLHDYSYRVLCILTDGEIVFGNVVGLLVYNRKKKEYRSIKLDDGVTSHWRMAAYAESLIWPDYA